MSWIHDGIIIAYGKPGGTPWIIDESLFAMTNKTDFIINNMTFSLNGEYKQIAGNETIVIYVVGIPGIRMQILSFMSYFQ